MTSRERLLTALNLQQPDRVPIDLGGNQTGIPRVAYQHLLDHLGLRAGFLDIADTPYAETVAAGREIARSMCRLRLSD